MLCLFCSAINTRDEWEDAQGKTARELHIPNSKKLCNCVAKLLGGLYPHATNDSKSQLWMPTFVCANCQRRWDKVDVALAKRLHGQPADFIRACDICDGETCALQAHQAAPSALCVYYGHAKVHQTQSAAIRNPTCYAAQARSRPNALHKTLTIERAKSIDCQRRTHYGHRRTVQLVKQELTRVGSCSASQFRRIYSRQECFRCYLLVPPA